MFGWPVPARVNANENRNPGRVRSMNGNGRKENVCEALKQNGPERPGLEQKNAAGKARHLPVFASCSTGCTAPCHPGPSSALPYLAHWTMDHPTTCSECTAHICCVRTYIVHTYYVHNKHTAQHNVRAVLRSLRASHKPWIRAGRLSFHLWAATSVYGRLDRKPPRARDASSDQLVDASSHGIAVLPFVVGT